MTIRIEHLESVWLFLPTIFWETGDKELVIAFLNRAVVFSKSKQ